MSESTTPPPRERTATAGSSALDELFAQLSHPLRRRVLRELLAADPGAELAREDLGGGPARPESDRLAMYHTHLPRLAGAGYIEWDRHRDTVARGPAFGVVAPTLVLLSDHREALPTAGR